MSGPSIPEKNYGDFLISKHSEIDNKGEEAEKEIRGEFKGRILKTLSDKNIKKTDNEIKLLATQALLIFRSTSSGKEILKTTTPDKKQTVSYTKGDHSKQDLIDRISDTVVENFQDKVSLSKDQIKLMESEPPPSTKTPTSKSGKKKSNRSRQNYSEVMASKTNKRQSTQPTEVHTPDASPKKEQPTVSTPINIQDKDVTSQPSLNTAEKNKAKDFKKSKPNLRINTLQTLGYSNKITDALKEEDFWKKIGDTITDSQAQQVILFCKTKQREINAAEIAATSTQNQGKGVGNFLVYKKGSGTRSTSEFIDKLKEAYGDKSLAKNERSSVDKAINILRKNEKYAHTRTALESETIDEEWQKYVEGYVKTVWQNKNI